MRTLRSAAIVDHAVFMAMAILAILALAGFRLEAQSAVMVKLVIVKKPGAPDGKAMATVKAPIKVKGKSAIGDKTGHIAMHVRQAWIILNGQGALLLLSPEKKGGQYQLRYYQLDEGKGRLLGDVPFAQATMEESQATGAPWAFALSGTDSSTKQPVIVAGDTQAIHARLADAADPHFCADALCFQSAGEPTTLKIPVLLGQETLGHIYAPRTPDARAAYLQFLPDGNSLITTTNGEVEAGRWITDGSAFRVTPAQTAKGTAEGRVTVWRLADLQTVTGVPAESHLNVRLLHPLSSRTAKNGMPVQAVLISPGVFDGDILVPQGSEFDGSLVAAHGVGWGIRHETAALTVHFDSIKLPDGHTLSIDARVFRVENARETVSPAGTIQGVRATGTLGHSAENQIASLTQIDPVAYMFTTAAGSAVLGFAEPEILYNAGTELDVAFNKPVITAKKYPPRVPRMDLSGSQSIQFGAIVRDLPFRTHTENTHQPSDITNLIFIGNPEALRHAFLAAGWTAADTLTAAATFETVKTLAGNQTYTQAPMSVLMLGDEKPIFAMEKSTNTFSSRHHVRVFATGETFDGEPVLTASSTQDIGIAFSYTQKTFIHVIDQYLDNERSKVTNDLDFTGCVDSVDLVSRPWVPRDAYNSTGDRLITDGDAAVLRLNRCETPYATPATPAQRAPLMERTERDTMLTIKDTLYRGNLVYTGISGGIKVHQYFATQGELSEDTGAWRRSDASGTEYRVVGSSQPQLQRKKWGGEASVAPAELDAEARARIAAHKWDPPHYEIGLNLGYSNYRNHDLESVFVILSSTSNPNMYAIGLADSVYDGWAASVSLTLNSWNWISNEFSYTREQTKFILESFSVEFQPQPLPPLGLQTVGWTTRRFAYNTVFNLRPRKSRWRPYMEAGPALQLLALASAPLKEPSGFFRLGLSNIGLLQAALDFGETPPLNGGGIYQPALQYGGGIKFRITPRLLMRADFGETWSANPNVVKNSYKGYIPTGLDNTYSTFVGYSGAPASYLQQHSTVGFAFTF
jgi:LssY C-terminus